MASPLYISEVHRSVVEMVLPVVQLCALVMGVEDVNWLGLAVVCLLVVLVVVLVEVLLDW